jgi:hypothetical protein
MIKTGAILIGLLLMAAPIQAKHLHKEKEYQAAWCRGESEVKLPNGNRADCLTARYAVEIDFAAKYHEAIGQALDYADQTGKEPAILLIIETKKDWRYYQKAKTLANHQGIRLWYITPEQL